MKTAYLWAYARDDRPFGGTTPPMVAYRFEDSRSGDCVARHLDGYGGILQVDGYAAYNRLAKADRTATPVTLAGCWAHVRRKFYELHADTSSPFASRTVKTMASLWAIEDGRPRSEPAERKFARQDQSVPIVALLFALWENELPSVSRKSRLAEAIRYAPSRRMALERDLEDGRIELIPILSSAPYGPRPSPQECHVYRLPWRWPHLGRYRNADHHRQDERRPHAGMTEALERIPNHWPNSRINELILWNFSR